MLGTLSSSTVVKNSFWNKNISNLHSSIGGGVGLSASEMLLEDTYTSKGWDFIDEAINGTENIWKMDSSNFNDGYPIANYQDAILSVSNLNLSKNITYPNPMTNDVYFQKPPKNDMIYDLTGRKIMQSDNSAVLRLNLEKLSSGSHMLKGEMEDKKTIVQNIIKK